MSAQRVKFVYDDDAHFEECNGESRPLTKAEYAQNSYRGCAHHWRAGTKTIDATVSPNVQGCKVCGNTHYTTIPYSEYLAYYGNPQMHVYVGYVVEEQCTHCKSWHHTDSLYGIDIMRDDPALDVVPFDMWIPMKDALQLPGDFGELMKEIQP